MPSQIFPFDTPSNYTYDSNKIAITGGKAQLKLIDYPGNDFQEDFADDIGFVYDSDKAEFSGGQVEQKDQRNYSNASFEASYSSVINGTRGLGALIGTPINGATITGSKLDLTGGRSVNYDADLNADSQQTLCIKFKATPNFTGAPPTDYPLITICKANGDSDNIIMIRLQSNGQLQIFIQDLTGAVIINTLQGVWNNVSGISYEFGLNVDITTGATRLFVENKGSGNCEQFGSTLTDTGTRDANIAFLNVGGNYNNIQFWDGYIEDLVIFPSVQNVTDYAAGEYSVPDYLYAASKVVVPEMQYAGAGTLIAVTNFVTSFVGSPRLTLEIGRSGDELYWDGAAWSVSNETYSQATDPATFAANAASLPVNGEMYGEFYIYFTGSNSQSSFSDLIITLTAQIYPVDNPTVEIISRWYLDDLEAFTETATKTGSDEIKYILKKGDTWYWFNSGVLEESDGTYSQSNTASEIETYKALFTSIKIYFAILLFMHSENGQTTPDIDTLTAQYSYAGDIPDTIDTCLVWGTQLDAEGNPSTDTIYVQLIDSAVQYKDTTVINKEIIEITPDSTGYWEVELIENANMVGNQGYKFTIDEYNYYKVVPDIETMAFFDLTDWT